MKNNSGSTGKFASRRRLLKAALAALAGGVPACESMRDLNILGYSTRPMYNCDIHTIHVPIFKNTTFYKKIEFDLTTAVVKAIEDKTPYKVVHYRDGADSELLGTIVAVTKNILNINPNNEIRQGEISMQVTILWRDLRTGEILSRATPQRQPMITPSLPAPSVDQQADGGLLPTTPGTSPVGPLVAPVEPRVDESPVPVTSTSTFIPELGQSLTTALQGNYDRMATQIVSMMEAPW